MNVFLLYLLLLKAALSSFSGLSSLPVIHADLVEHHRVLTDTQLNTAVAVGRSGPGPIGLYMVSVGYYVAGVPGAAAGWLAMVTPAFLILPLLFYAARYAAHPTVRSAIRSILLASAGLLLSAAVPLGREGLADLRMAPIAAASFFILAFTRIDSVWVMLGAAAAGLLISVTITNL